jgi:hypothetical protein
MAPATAGHSAFRGIAAMPLRLIARIIDFSVSANAEGCF